MITTIFSTYNGARTLPTMLASLSAINEPSNWEVIAVNNGSTDSTQEILDLYAPKLPLRILQQPIRGKNNALNLALQQNHLGELVVFTDDDIIPAPDWLQKLECCADIHEEYHIFGGAILPYWEQTASEYLFNAIPLGVTYALTEPNLTAGPIYPGLVWGPNMMVRKSVFDAGHRFDISVGPNTGAYIMGSETEFNIRMGKLGYHSWFCPEAKVQHIIRDFQMTEEWVVKRAFRFGKNACVQEYRDSGFNSDNAWFFKNFSFPRWMARSLAENFITGHILKLTGNRSESLKRRWEAAYLHGFITQAQHFHRANN